jgi:hypothetical protein
MRVISAALCWPYYACDYGELARSASAKSPNSVRDTSLDGTTNGSAEINVDAGIYGATPFGRTALWAS